MFHVNMQSPLSKTIRSIGASDESTLHHTAALLTVRSASVQRVVITCVVLSGSVFRGDQSGKFCLWVQRQDVGPAVHPKGDGACKSVLHQHHVSWWWVWGLACWVSRDNSCSVGWPWPSRPHSRRSREDEHEEVRGHGRDPLPHQRGQLHGEDGEKERVSQVWKMNRNQFNLDVFIFYYTTPPGGSMWV